MGKFIVFEGGEGSGKSTQVKLLAAKMRESGHDVLETKEPGSQHSLEAVRIREVILNREHKAMTPLAELLLFYADRAQHLATVVEPALASGQDVISDRYYYSTIAYQLGGGKVAQSSLASVHQAVSPRKADVVILLNIDAVTGLARKKSQDEINRMEDKDLEFHQRVNKEFRISAELEPHIFLAFDATDTIETLSEKIWAEVEKRL